MTIETFGPLAVLGGGNMARSIIRGGLHAGVLEPRTIIVCEPDAAKHADFAAMGVRATANHAEAMADGWPMLLAVKPQSFAELAGQMRPHIAGRPYLAISILAGTTAAKVQMGLGAQGRVVRVMPNTAAAVGLSTSAVARGPGATSNDVLRAERLFGAIGTTVLIDESKMDAATAVVGSGPAYLYYIAEAMLKGAREVGLSETEADRMVRGTITGAAAMLAGMPGSSPQELRAMVTSRGGTTAAAIEVLERAGVGDAVVQAVAAARDRGRELAQIDAAKPA